jgi:hypothetical protein
MTVRPYSSGVAQSDRLIGAVLYGTTTVALGGLLSWWLVAAPDTGQDAEIVAWRASVARILPEDRHQIDARTLVLRPGQDVDQDSPQVFPGPHELFVVCAGREQVRVRLSSSLGSGTPVPCTEVPTPVQIQVALSGPLFLSIVSEARGPVALRWQLRRAGA